MTLTFQVNKFFIDYECTSWPVVLFFSSPVGSLCHTRGVVRRPSSVIRRVSSVSTITTRNN